MPDIPRREFLLRSAGMLGAAATASILPPSIRRALSINAAVQSGTIQDVKHVIILMQENRSFDHYFGTMRGVRGFADPFPVPLASGKPVWFESDGTKEIPPYHLNPATTSALLVPDMPHGFADTQAAWKQGIFGEWPRFKTQFSMGYYRRADIPFQYALADAFTICDAYHCSVTSGTDPNRIVLFSGSNFDPAQRAEGKNCTASNAEVNNQRCLVSGTMPSPGYKFSGSGLTWPTLPEILQDAGISWQIYQDPNDNWNGLMHGGLAFQAFREATAASGSALYARGMTSRTISELQSDAANGALPQVSWILPTPEQSEHPARSNPDAAGYFISQVLDAVSASPQVWSQTVIFLMLDENDGLFDHMPPPAAPSYNRDGSLAGASTVALDGEYFADTDGKYTSPEDSITGNVRPWGLGARVPMYVISPWSRGGWVNSQVFDHTSIGMFLEKRFGIQLPNISPWHRAISGDLISAFDFTSPNDASLPVFPDMRNYGCPLHRPSPNRCFRNRASSAREPSRMSSMRPPPSLPPKSPCSSPTRAPRGSSFMFTTNCISIAFRGATPWKPGSRCKMSGPRPPTVAPTISGSTGRAGLCGPSRGTRRFGRPAAFSRKSPSPMTWRPVSSLSK